MRIFLLLSLGLFNLIQAESGSMPATSPPEFPTHEEVQTLARKGLLDSAFLLSKQILAASPQDSFAQFMVAKLNPNGNASAAAFKKILKSGKRNAQSEESYFRLGQFNYATGKYLQSITYFRDYLKNFPAGEWTSPTLYWTGNACLSYATVKPKYLDSALDYFELLQKSQNKSEYYFTLAREGTAKALLLKGDRAKALEAAIEALSTVQEEEKSTLLLLLAQINSGSDAMEEKKYLDQVLSQYPQSPEARYLKKMNAGVEPSRWRSGTGNSKTQTKKTSQLDTAKVPTLQSVPVTEKNFTLQLGAFSQKANAETMMLQVAKMGLRPELITTQKNGKHLFQVRLGKFESPEQAVDFAQKNLKPHQVLSQPVPTLP